jgi:hypothetical protein
MTLPNNPTIILPDLPLVTLLKKKLQLVGSEEPGTFSSNQEQSHILEEKIF